MAVSLGGLLIPPATAGHAGNEVKRKFKYRTGIPTSRWFVYIITCVVVSLMLLRSCEVLTVTDRVTLAARGRVHSWPCRCGSTLNNVTGNTFAELFSLEAGRSVPQGVSSVAFLFVRQGVLFAMYEL